MNDCFVRMKGSEASRRRARLFKVVQTNLDPLFGQFFLQRILLQTLGQGVEIHAVEILILIEARENESHFAGKRVALRLKALGANLFHHALHRRVDGANGEVMWLHVRFKHVVACATHGVLSGPAIQRIAESPLDEVVVSDTIPLSPAARTCSKIKQVSMARLLGEAIKRIHSSDSVSSLFA